MPDNTKDSFRYQIENDLWIACAWNKAIHRSLFDDGTLYFVEGITAEDIDWSVRLGIAAKSFDYINDVVVCYRQREFSISQNITVQKTTTLFDNIDGCLMLLQQANDTNKAQLLESFVSYQYGTAIIRLAVLPKSADRDNLLARAKRNQYLLKRSKNKKIRLLSLITSIGGIRLTLWLLKLRSNR